MMCDTCNGDISMARIPTHYMLETYTAGQGNTARKPYCSPSCLVEGAWMIKDGQRKLSKSASK